ncbi:restriction endonuclease [Pedobacter punctiformis]|uniref:Restriction endonuclease n=1 Tax=Pedobacter punctiformis TaxID=3004097 RepID=A0ABT4LC09_9SPHI|nr:restriction endonuclease [Pedobacter sp. HCMS5-2]MCZ4245461.1 restriction endonuclease [Pedobacter sp. HCMS5-2]
MKTIFNSAKTHMPKKTINEAIAEALKREGQPLRVGDIYKRIIEDDLYRFNAINPEHIVRTQLRRHSENLNFPTAHKSKHFIFLTDGHYWVKGVPHKSAPTAIAKVEQLPLESNFEQIKSLHEKYLLEFKASTLHQLTQLDPFSFEEFCKRLLLVYGFKNLKVTSKTKDGGIDGYGELKIGLVYMKVAFECKRWTKASIGRPKINQFRGDIQGKYQQGIFFTTSKFSNDAKSVSFQNGAVPIVLIDGQAIVDIMIEKNFGIEKEVLPIYTNAIDLVLQDIE